MIDFASKISDKKPCLQTGCTNTLQTKGYGVGQGTDFIDKKNKDRVFESHPLRSKSTLNSNYLQIFLIKSTKRTLTVYNIERYRCVFLTNTLQTEGFYFNLIKFKREGE